MIIQSNIDRKWHKYENCCKTLDGYNSQVLSYHEQCPYLFLLTLQQQQKLVIFCFALSRKTFAVSFSCFTKGFGLGFDSQRKDVFFYCIIISLVIFFFFYVFVCSNIHCQ